VVAAGALALGLATGVPSMLPRSQVHEVASSCGYMLTMLALAAIWGALHEPQRRCRWLAIASVAYGLAVGARPSLLFGAVILLVPVVQAWRERRPEGLPRFTWLFGAVSSAYGEMSRRSKSRVTLVEVALFLVVLTIGWATFRAFSVAQQIEQIPVSFRTMPGAYFRIADYVERSYYDFTGLASLKPGSRRPWDCPASRPSCWPKSRCLPPCQIASRA